MPDEKDLHDPRNPCYDDEQRKLFISKKKFPKQATSTTDRDEAVGNKPLKHFIDENNTDNTGTSK